MTDPRADELVCLVYVSAARRELSEDELLALLRACRENNARLGITGMLLYKGGNFLQLLEGPRDGVVGLFERIQCDPRHHRVIRLMLAPIARRQFDRWSMAFGNVDLISEPDRAGFSDFLNKPFAEPTFGEHPDRALKLLLDFRRVIR